MDIVKTNETVNSLGNFSDFRQIGVSRFQSLPMYILPFLSYVYDYKYLRE